MTVSVTQEEVDNAVERVQYYHFPESTYTICLITLKDGWNVTGESSCIDPQMFDAEIGKQIAFEQAKEKIWQFLGYKKFLNM